MSAPVTPEEWLPVLLQNMNEALPRIRRNLRYTSGQPDLPEMGHNLRKSWQRFQKKAVTDFGGLAVSSFCDRLQLNGVTIGGDTDHPHLPLLRRVMRDSRAPVQVQDAVRDAERTGRGYLVSMNERLYRVSPEVFYAEPRLDDPIKARAAVHIVRDSIAKLDTAVVWTNGQVQVFTRPTYMRNGKPSLFLSGGWNPEGEPYPVPTDVPVVILEREDGKGLVEQHYGVIDRINLGKLQRLVTTAMQAFKQRAIRPGQDGEVLPAEDEDGNQIDWAKVLEPAPGALWDLPVPIDIWESAPTDIRPLLEGERTDIRDFAAVTGVPLAMFMPEQQSAAGAANLPMQFVLKAKAEIKRFKPALDLALVYALRDNGVHLAEEDTVESLWADPERVTVTERFAAAAQAKAAGLSERTIKRDILGMSPEQIMQDEVDSSADMLTEAIKSGGNSDATTGETETTKQHNEPG